MFLCHPWNNWQCKDTILNLVPTYWVGPLESSSTFFLVHFTSLGHFYFTKLLLPTLLAAAKTSPDGKARIVNTSSSAHAFTGPIEFNTLKDGPARTKKGPQPLYSQSKLVCFLSFQSYTDVYVIHREISKYQTNLPNDMEKKASYLPLLIPEILDPMSSVISPLFSTSC